MVFRSNKQDEILTKVNNLCMAYKNGLLGGEKCI